MTTLTRQALRIRHAARNAITDAAEFAECEICGEQIAAVDTKRDRETGRLAGGQWIHVELPVEVHPAMPRRSK